MQIDLKSPVTNFLNPQASEIYRVHLLKIMNIHQLMVLQEQIIYLVYEKSCSDLLKWNENVYTELRHRLSLEPFSLLVSYYLDYIAYLQTGRRITVDISPVVNYAKLLLIQQN